MSSEVTLARQIKCVKRELGMRNRVYPRRVAEGKMRPDEADDEIRAMAAVLNTLRELEASRG